MSARFEPMSTKERSQVILTRAAAQTFLPKFGEFHGRLTCQRCRSTVNFTIFANGVSHGGCTAACGVKWTQ
jgi:hypothetical protein